MRIIREFLRDIKLISQKSHLTIWQRYSLGVAYVKIRSIRFLFEQVLKKDFKKISFLEFTVFVDTPGSFFGTFVEVFLREEYFFPKPPEGTVIIDAGANIGLSTLYFKWRFPEIIVHSYEPHPDTFSILDRNVRSNFSSQIFIHQSALGKKNGEVAISGNARQATVEKDMHTFNTRSAEVQNVKIARLSTEIEKTKSLYYYLKMDVEGSELAIIEDLFNSGKFNFFPLLIFEYHPITDESERLKKIKFYLEESGFTISPFPQKDNLQVIITAKRINYAKKT